MDAPSAAIGPALLQNRDDDKIRSVQFAIRIVIGAEKLLSVWEKEICGSAHRNEV